MTVLSGSSTISVQTADQTIPSHEEIEIVASSADVRWSENSLSSNLQEISSSFFITFYSYSGFTMTDKVYLKNGDFRVFYTSLITLSPAVTSIDFAYASTGEPSYVPF